LLLSFDGRQRWLGSSFVLDGFEPIHDPKDYMDDTFSIQEMKPKLATSITYDWHSHLEQHGMKIRWLPPRSSRQLSVASITRGFDVGCEDKADEENGLCIEIVRFPDRSVTRRIFTRYFSNASSIHTECYGWLRITFHSLTLLSKALKDVPSIPCFDNQRRD
jgi:hypothetical protein